MMNPQQNAQRVAELFEALIDLEPDVRGAYLSEACGDDAELRREVEALLALHARDDVDDTDALLFPPLFADSAASLIGRQLGPYLIRQLIFEGGMGVVYLAEREDVGTRVALKLVRHGRFAAPEHLQRFLLERRLLARLEHPNIARLLDAGVTEDGLPYLVMEFVAGTPIDHYCDQQRLTIEDRLTLFLEVCRAVEYAHRHLIVHRDLKPSNILVIDYGVPKLLDFGVAKLLDEPSDGASGLTRAGQAPLTPEYASPEQLRAGPVTTQSDLYSLGVLLYKLLSGHRPYQLDTRSPLEAERVVSSVQPERLSTVVMRPAKLRHADGSTDEITPATVSAARRTQPQRLQRQLRGDLDTVVLKALQKEPERRYRSVQELAEDIGRYLQRQPVRARPDTLRYRTRRFVQRNRAGVALGAAAALSLVVGLAVALWQGREASLQRDLAMETAHTMIFELAEALSRLPGPTEAQLGLLEAAAGQFERQAGRRFAREDHQRRAADAHRVLSLTYLKLGDTDRALHHAETALALARRLVAKNGTSPENRLLLAGSLSQMGSAFDARHRLDDALAAYRESIVLGHQLVRELPDDFRVLRALYLALVARADGLPGDSGEDESAAELYERAFAVSEQLVRLEPEIPQFNDYYATSLNRSGSLLWAAGKGSESCAAYRNALAVRQRVFDQLPEDADVRTGFAQSLLYVAWCHREEQDHEAALRLSHHAVGIQRQLFASDTANLNRATHLLGGLHELGQLFRLQRAYPEAIAQFRAGLEVAERFHRRGQTDPSLVQGTAALSDALAKALLSLQRDEEAREVLEQQKQRLDGFVARDPNRLEYRSTRAHFLITYGDFERVQGRIRQGLARYREAVGEYRRVTAATGRSRDWQRVAWAQYKVAMALKYLDETEPARAELLAARQILLDLRAAGQFSDSSDGWANYLPGIEQELAGLWICPQVPDRSLICTR